MKVSVLMPAYNAESSIVNAINSILNQTYTNIELLICDDGSNDNTVKMVQSFNDERIKLIINDSNIGNLATTNKLFALANGDMIAIQDADDYSHPQRIQKQVEKINKESLDIIGTDFSIVLNGELIDNVHNISSHNDIIKKMKLSRHVPILWPSVMFKKEVYLNIGNFDPIFDRIGAADYNWLHRASFKYRLGNLSEVLYTYVQHTNSFTKKNLNINTDKFYSEEIAYDIYKYFVEEKLDYDFNISSKLFLELSKKYNKTFIKNEKRLIEISWQNYILKNMKFKEYILLILKSNTDKKTTTIFLFAAILVGLIGYRNAKKFFKLIKK